MGGRDASEYPGTLRTRVGGQRVAGPSRSGTGARRSRYFPELGTALGFAAFGCLLLPSVSRKLSHELTESSEEIRVPIGTAQGTVELGTRRSDLLTLRVVRLAVELPQCFMQCERPRMHLFEEARGLPLDPCRVLHVPEVHAHHCTGNRMGTCARIRCVGSVPNFLGTLFLTPRLAGKTASPL